MKITKGFTLIELLVVIGIIGILAAIIFPVYGRVKDSAYRSGDMAQMNSIRLALQLYRTDQGGFPPSILGYATGYANFTPSATDIVPAEKVASANVSFQNEAFMYPKRIDSVQTLRPAYDRVSDTAFTTAVWPSGLTSASGSSGFYQKFGPNDGFVQRCVDIGDGNGPLPRSAYYYAISGFDVGNVEVPGAPTQTRTELRYTPFWSNFTVPLNPCAPTASEQGSALDSPRQLGYTDPPETTVITWDSFFRNYDANGNPTSGGLRDLVVFLGGNAKPMDSAVVSAQAWQVNP